MNTPAPNRSRMPRLATGLAAAAGLGIAAAGYLWSRPPVITRPPPQEATALPDRPAPGSLRMRQNLSGEQVAVVLRRGSGPACRQDTLLLGVHLFALGPRLDCTPEVLAFAEDYGVESRRPPGRSEETLELTFGLPRRVLDVTLWIPDDSSIKQKEKALRKGLQRADQLFNEMRCGIQLSREVKRLVRTPRPPGQVGTRGAVPPIDCETDFDALEKDGLFDSTRLNLYVRKEFSYHGQWCGKGVTGKPRQVVILGSTRNSETMAHEIGHALGLEDGEVQSSQKNLMHQDCQMRTTITLGQCFAMNYSNESALGSWAPSAVAGRDCSVAGECLDRTCLGCDPATPPPRPQLTDAEVVRRWLQCEDCAASDEQTVIALYDKAVGELRSWLLYGVPDDVKTPLQNHLIETYRSLAAYEVRRKELEVPGYDQDAFVKDHVTMLRDSTRTRAGRALIKLAPTSKAAAGALHEASKLALPAPLKLEVDRAVKTLKQ